MKKKSLSRFSVSMAGDLVRQLDAMSKAKGYANRSQAIADMVRAHLVEHHSQIGSHEITGTVTVVYDHHKRNIQALLTDIQHDHQNLIIATLHVHLDHHNCMEVLAVRGRAHEVKHVADKLIAAKGVTHGKLTVTTTGKAVSHAHT
ncbi:MAG: nickel-responsive transcriptional regulator NikR [Candidatus Eisenbacteria bacterium]|nr:nickel-responsive transcriptional regulator NikR [Candidatus Eisenbacteria bacterium]